MSFDPAFHFFTDGQPADRPMDLSDEWWSAMKIELRVELADRQRLYPARVVKGRMTRVEADKELRVWRGILQAFDVRADRPAAGPEATWTEQAHGLRREIGLRRRYYPQWVLAGRVEGAEADRKLLLLEQWHDLLWHQCSRPEAVAARADVARRLSERERAAA